MTLSGQEYVDMYATRAKELIADGEPADSRSMLPVSVPAAEPEESRQ